MIVRACLLLALFACACGLSGCILNEADSMNPNFAGSMKIPAGAIGPSKPLSEMLGSRVREGE